jgi:hypothetical protein
MAVTRYEVSSAADIYLLGREGKRKQYDKRQLVREEEIN